MSGKIIQLEREDYAAWDWYIDQHPQGSFYHLSGWKELIERCYGHRCYFLYYRDNNHIQGVLPLVEQKSLLFGHSLVSTPICVVGGVVANSPQITLLLVEYAKSLAQKLKVDYLELRGQQDFVTSEMALSAPKQQKHLLLGCELAGSEQQILARIKKKQRAVIRQSLQGELCARVEQDITNCFHIYSTSVRNLGTPVFPKRSFIELKKIFAQRCEIFTVFNQHKPVSSVMSFYYKNKVLPHYGGGLAEARALKSNDYMYYQLMCHARNKGCDYFDFGRSKIDSGSYRYKKHWGMNETVMNYQYFLVNSNKLPALNVNNPKYRSMIQLWKKLPLMASQTIGPLLAKHLG